MRREVGWLLAGSWLLILLLVVVPYVLLQDPFAWSASSFHLGDFSTVDAIEVSTAHSQLDDAAPMITDPERVRRVVAAVDRLATGWQIPWAGAPRGRLGFRLFSDEVVVADFEMGPGFLVAVDGGAFYSRPIAPADQQELVDALGVSAQDLLAANARETSESRAP